MVQCEECAFCPIDLHKQLIIEKELGIKMKVKCTRLNTTLTIRCGKCVPRCDGKYFRSMEVKDDYSNIKRW